MLGLPDLILLGNDRLGNSSSGPLRKQTVGSLDMGGASTQITFEVPKSVSKNCIYKNCYIYTIS